MSPPSPPRRLGSLPPLAAAAYHGIAGEVVADIAPHTEADPAALLVSLLAGVGAMIGDGPHVMIGASRHPARIWPLVIGRTASGRKGESWAQTEQLVVEADADFAANRLTSGLSTGEGIIACFADDKGPDKRLLVIESEFARPLAAARREGNTLSPALRDLWDRGRAGVMTRGQPLHCHGAHLVIIAHVTPRELIAKLTDSDIAGGLLNRFLPILVQRPQLLPNPKTYDVAQLGYELAGRIGKAQSPRSLARNTTAQTLWGSAYTAMARDEADGPLGEVLARGPAYTMRIALTYALLDGAAAIGEDHLTAALAIWAYASASARRVFADTARQTDADKLGDFLADSRAGRTRTEIRDLFGRNKSTKQIDTLLEELGPNVAIEEDREGDGRPVQRVYWIGANRTSLDSLLAGEPQPARPNDVTTNAGQGSQDFGRTTKVRSETAQVNGDMSSDRNVVRVADSPPINWPKGSIGAEANSADAPADALSSDCGRCGQPAGGYRLCLGCERAGQ